MEGAALHYVFLREGVSFYNQELVHYVVTGTEAIENEASIQT